MASLDAGWDVVGPQFQLGGFIFPPADPTTPTTELARWRAGRSVAAFQSYFARQMVLWSRIWDAPGPVAVPTLSGALLGFRRDLVARFGPWPEEYFLYFEETEWLRRVRRGRGRLAVVPAARARHAWGHAAEPGRLGQRYERSRQRFLRRHWPLTGRLAARLGGGSLPLPLLDERPDEEGGADRFWLLTPAAAGFPAARQQPGTPLAAAFEAFLRELPAPRPLTLLLWDAASRRVVAAVRHSGTAEV